LQANKTRADAVRAIQLSEEENPYQYKICCRSKILLHEEKSTRKDLGKAKKFGYVVFQKSNSFKFFS
jgi:hypothetical protein